MQKFIRRYGWLLIMLPVISFIEPSKEKINWIDVKQLNELYAANPKPILVDVYTDWCGWCKEMDRVTYYNQKLVAYVNAHYYAVRLNAESTDSLMFNKIKYGYDASTRTNELAAFLLYNRMEFPTTVFLSGIDAKPAPLVGYMKAKELELPLKYFAEGASLTQGFEAFSKSAKKEW